MSRLRGFGSRRNESSSGGRGTTALIEGSPGPGRANPLPPHELRGRLLSAVDWGRGPRNRECNLRAAGRSHRALRSEGEPAGGRLSQSPDSFADQLSSPTHPGPSRSRLVRRRRAAPQATRRAPGSPTGFASDLGVPTYGLRWGIALDLKIRLPLPRSESRRSISSRISMVPLPRAVSRYGSSPAWVIRLLSTNLRR